MVQPFIFFEIALELTLIKKEQNMTKTQEIYRIGQLAKIVDLTAYTLRYYEREGLIKSNRDENGDRYFTQDDVRWIEFLLHLKTTGMTIHELKQYVVWRAQGDETIEKRKKLLEHVRVRSLAEIRQREASLKIVNHKIDWYEGKLDHTIADNEDFKDYLAKFSN